MKKCNDCNIIYEDNINYCKRCGKELGHFKSKSNNQKKDNKSSTLRYIIGVLCILIGISNSSRSILFVVFGILFGISLLPITYDWLDKIKKINKNVFIQKNLKLIKITIPILLLILWVSISNIKRDDYKPSNYQNNYNDIESDDNEEDEVEIEDNNSKNTTINTTNSFETNLKKVLKEIGWEEADIKSIKDEGSWAMGDYYSFYYHGSRYYVSTYSNNEIYTIAKQKNVSKEKDYIYKNNNVQIKDENEDTISLQWNQLGEYGKYDAFDGEKEIRFYIPKGNYIVKALNKNAMFFIEKKKIYKNTFGNDESDIVEKITLSKIGDIQEISIKTDECLSLVNNTYISLEKK